MSEDKLEDFLRVGKYWSRLRTNVQGVFVLKLPAYKSSPTRLAVELNPVDEYSNPKKRRGLILRSSKELDDFKELFNYEKLYRLLSMLDAINPKVEREEQRKGEEILEL